MNAKAVERRLTIFMVLITLIFAVLVSRLAYLQLVHSEKYTKLSEANRIRLVPIPAPRGEIKDRNGEIIAKEKPVFSVSIDTLNLKNTDKVIDELARILGMKPDDIKDILKNNKQRKYEPIKIAKDVSPEIVTRIEERKMELPGVLIDIEPMRNYVKGDFATHILGYVREISDKQLKENKSKGYKMGDRFGQAGIENAYEEYLRGIDGAKLVEVNQNNQPVRELKRINATPGNDLYLTIDAKVQKAAEEALDRMMLKLQTQGTDKIYPNAKAGAVVLIDVKSGKVIAMASKPSYDPNLFNGKIEKKFFEEHFAPQGEFTALNNRAIMNHYPPGSTFKMVTATAGLETKSITPKTIIHDGGLFPYKGRSYKCWKPGGHGSVDLIKAIQQSCNVYFYTVGSWTGIDAIAKYAKQYGLGLKSGIDLPNEKSGLMPTPEWKKETFEEGLNKRYEKIYKQIEEEFDKKINDAKDEKERKKLIWLKEQKLKQKKAMYKIEYKWVVEWQGYETVITSIGQGNNRFTPLQLANYIATIANGGTRYRPYLVDRVLSPHGKVVKQFEPQVLNRVDVSPETLQWIKQGMRSVVETGTAASTFRGFPVAVAGKTGTAQSGFDKKGLPKDDHGWFVGFAPYDDPQVAVAVIVEYGGHGGNTAGVVARDVLAAYFNVDQNQQEQGQNEEE